MLDRGPCHFFLEGHGLKTPQKNAMMVGGHRVFTAEHVQQDGGSRSRAGSGLHSI